MARKKTLESLIALHKKAIIKTPKLKPVKRGGYKEVKTPSFKPFKFKF